MVGVYLGALPEGTYWGISGYFYAMNGIGLVDWNDEWSGTVGDIEPAAMDYCSKTFSEAKESLPYTDPEYVSGYCLSSVLATTSLRAFGAGDLMISYARKRNGQTVDWTVGALATALDEVECPKLE